jgi:hypothetical protein
MKTGRPTVPPDYVTERFLKCIRKKKSIYSLIFMSISIELKMSKIISAFFFRVLSGFYQSVILFLREFPYPELRFLTFFFDYCMTLFMFL